MNIEMDRLRSIRNASSRAAQNLTQRAIKSLKTVRNKLAMRGKVHNLKQWLEQGKEELKKNQEKQAYANVAIAKTLKSLRPATLGRNIATRKGMMNANRAARTRVPNTYMGRTKKALPTTLLRNIHRMKTASGNSVASFYGIKQKKLDNTLKSEIDTVAKRIKASSSSKVNASQKRALLKTLAGMKNAANMARTKRMRHAQFMRNIYGL